jgi:hypothetical protein
MLRESIYLDDFIAYPHIISKSKFSRIHT